MFQSNFLHLSKYFEIKCVPTTFTDHSTFKRTHNIIVRSQAVQRVNFPHSICDRRNYLVSSHCGVVRIAKLAGALRRQRIVMRFASKRHRCACVYLRPHSLLLFSLGTHARRWHQHTHSQKSNIEETRVFFHWLLRVCGNNWANVRKPGRHKPWFSPPLCTVLIRGGTWKMTIEFMAACASSLFNESGCAHIMTEKGFLFKKGLLVLRLCSF